MMEDILVTGATIVTMDAARRVIADGAMAVSGGRIVAVGPREEVEAAHSVARIVDGRGKILMPGLIDVHAHAGHGLIKSMGMTDGDRWEAICGEVYTTGSTPEFWHAEARLAALERLRFGVTCGVSLLGGGDTVMRTDDPVHGEAHARGVAEVGTRAIVAVGPTRAPHPRTYATIGEEGETTRYPVDFDRQMRTCETLIARLHGSAGGRVRIALVYPVLRDEHEAGMAPDDYAEAVRQVRAVRALSRATAVLFTQDGHWRGSVRRAHALGLLGPDALLSHAIDLHEDEIALCAQTGTRIAHNPSAVASIKGRCPAIELMEAGVVVALGSDATAPDRSGDMFRHMQQAMHYHRRHYRDASVLPVGKALEMATIDAATALGLAGEIGSLEPGKRADAILVDGRRAHLAPANMPVHRVVAFANGNDVETVMVDGEILLEAGRPTRVDPLAIALEAERQADLMIARIGAQDALDVAPGWGRPRG
ncbi:amidohydrolase family protein [Salinarimonas chemoclinalis]|uniref:amidohydrolase family protein n=1 Tax=Salinarimonas chemoclinalis TaxID=3241599 RepID=UPI0035565E64